MRRIWLMSVLAAVMLGLFWLAPTASAADEDVTIAGFAFAPDHVTVSVGDTVTWTNNDGVAHTATADDGSFNTGNIGGGGSESVTFDTAGTFAYHCRIHAAMTGTVVVESAAGGGGAPTTPPTDTAGPEHSSGGTAGVFGAVAFLALMSLIAARRLARQAR
jgi:plastocyanin